MNTISTETLKEIAGKLESIMPETVLRDSSEAKECLPNIGEVESF